MVNAELPAPVNETDLALSEVKLPTRIRNALHDAGFKTVSEVRETSDASLLSLQNMGRSSVETLRRLVAAKRQA